MNKKKIVRLVKDWDYPSIMRQTQQESGDWGNYHFTEKPVKECDLLVVLNYPPYKIDVRCPDGRKWLFMQEPPINSYDWHKKSYKYFDRIYAFWDNCNHSLMHSQTALPWHLNKTYNELQKLSIDDCHHKLDKLSWVTSSKSNKPGHKLRLHFKTFLDSRKFNYNLMGRGFKPIDDKFSGIFPYKYSLAIENFSCNDYWTEKLSDCFLSWTMPIYWGAKNILDYFPENSMIIIDLEHNIEESLNKITEAIDSNLWEKNLDAIAEARRRILDEYQFFPFVSSLLKASEKNNNSPKLINSKIPKLKRPNQRTQNIISNKIYGFLNRK